MSFDDLPPLPPLLHPTAAGYAERVCAGTREAMRTCRTVLDVPYGPDYWQRLDVYLPADPPRGEVPLPVLCYLHGGAWSNGCKEWMGFMAPALVDLPMIFVSMTYRRAPAVRLPDMVSDCFDGLSWVHRHIREYGGDPTSLHVGGHSAGAHLAALLALRTDLLESRGIPPAVIRACFPTSGTFDFRVFERGAGAVEAKVLDEVLPSPEDAWEWSPLRVFETTRVPFHVTWGEHDFPRVVAQGRALVAAAAAFPGRVSWHEAPGLDHFTVNEDAGRLGNRWSTTVRTMMAADRRAVQGDTR